jgi:hypothetical protein
MFSKEDDRCTTFSNRSLSCFAACAVLPGKVSSIDFLGIDAYAEDDLGDAPS